MNDLMVSRAFGAPGVRLRDLIRMLERAELPPQAPTAPRGFDELVHARQLPQRRQA